jgi:hypothetical protein
MSHIAIQEERNGEVVTWMGKNNSITVSSAKHFGKPLVNKVADGFFCYEPRRSIRASNTNQ